MRNENICSIAHVFEFGDCGGVAGHVEEDGEVQLTGERERGRPKRMFIQ